MRWLISQSICILTFDRNPQNQLRLHDAEMHVTYRILEHYDAFLFFSPTLPQWNALFLKQFESYC